MAIRGALDRAVQARNLLEHPFYRAWSAGTLPGEALRAYAREYGAFVATLPEGWMTLEDEETAEEEREHAFLWEAFAAALGTSVGDGVVPEVRALLRVARTQFASPASAAGALYAFERQQPATAKSKLAGLRAFYAVGPEAERYFDLHTRNEHEAEKLAARIEGLDDEGRARALSACQDMCQALWEALSGLHAGACPTA